jgi:NAD(P)-dependent dehydrogenase (short-subunit alcohol dehydrogenase family)
VDVTSDEDAVAAARTAGNINLLINNAGIARPGGFLADGAVEAAREQFEVNFVGPLRMTRAFAPVLAKNGGGAIINVLSVASWINGPTLATYGASKSAAWALTNGLRVELAREGTQVVALHAAFIDTDLARNIDAPKSSPEEIARTTLDALERGEGEVLADEITRQVHRGLSADLPVYFPDHRRASVARGSADWLSRRTVASTRRKEQTLIRASAATSVGASANRRYDRGRPDRDVRSTHRSRTTSVRDECVASGLKKSAYRISGRPRSPSQRRYQVSQCCFRKVLTMPTMLTKSRAKVPSQKADAVSA